MTIYDDDATGDATMTWYTVDEVATHKKESDCWLILGETGEKKVYNITSFLDDHPGGPEILLDIAGEDGQDDFEDIGHSSDAIAKLPKYCIGHLKEYPSTATKATGAESTNVRTEKKDHQNNNAWIPLGCIIVLILAIFIRTYLS